MIWVGFTVNRDLFTVIGWYCIHFWTFQSFQIFQHWKVSRWSFSLGFGHPGLVLPQQAVSFFATSPWPFVTARHGEQKQIRKVPRSMKMGISPKLKMLIAKLQRSRMKSFINYGINMAACFAANGPLAVFFCHNLHSTCSQWEWLWFQFPKGSVCPCQGVATTVLRPGVSSVEKAFCVAKALDASGWILILKHWRFHNVCLNSSTLFIHIDQRENLTIHTNLANKLLTSKWH